MKKFIIGLIFTSLLSNSFASFTDSILVANKIVLIDNVGDTVQILILGQDHEYTLQFIRNLNEKFNKVNTTRGMVWDITNGIEIVYFPNNNTPNPPIFIIKRKVDEIFWDRYIGNVFRSDHWKSKNGTITIVKPN